MNMVSKIASNYRIAAQAVKAVTAKTGFEKKPTFCQRFARQVVQRVYGSKYDKYFKGTALETMEAFRDSPYAVDPKRGSVPGDLLYKGRAKSGPAGHVGIRVEGNRVAENSSFHITHEGDKEARGFRTLQQFGEPDLIVRLPID
jgi:hypothetical protein